MFTNKKKLRTQKLKRELDAQQREAGSGQQSVSASDLGSSQGVRESRANHLIKYTVSKNPWRLLWGEIGEFEGPHEIFDRLQNVWDTVLGLGGLVAGFSYIVLSANIEFPKEGIIGSEFREYVYGFFSVLTFVIALGSALLTVILQNTLKMAGPDCASWFSRKYEALVGMPEALVGTSIGCMLFAGLVAIDGLFPPFVFWFAVISGFGSFIALGVVWFFVSNGLKAKAASIMLKKRGIANPHEKN